MPPRDRRPLTAGLTPEPEVDSKAAHDFVYQGNPNPPTTPGAKPAPPARLNAARVSPPTQSALVPLTARIPAEKFQALKRASFERQLEGVEPSSMQDIVEEALTPWLRKHGYLP